MASQTYSSEMIRQAIQAVKAGRRVEAPGLLRRAVEADPSVTIIHDWHGIEPLSRTIVPLNDTE